jgi:hypothetical protein
MKLLQRGAYSKANALGSLALSVAVLIILPSLSPAEAQASRQTASDHTKLASADKGVDSLEQLSTSMELLSKRVSPSVVQIFSTGYRLDTDPNVTTPVRLLAARFPVLGLSLPPMVGL